MFKKKEFLIELGHILPLYLLSLVLYPMFLGFIIDFDLSNFRSFVISLIWMQIFTIPFVLTKRLFFYKLGLWVYFLIGAVEILHWVVIRGPITLTSLLVISNTNISEAVEFIDVKGSYQLLLLIPFISVFYFGLKAKPEGLIKSKPTRIVFYGIVIFSLIFISENIVNNSFVRLSSPQIVKVSASFINELERFKEASKERFPIEIDVDFNKSNDSQTFVLIIGESANRNHFSLYGYEKRTTPKLSNKDGLYVFDNVVSPYSNTIEAVRMIMSNSNLERQIPDSQKVDLIDVFHSAGFKTFWLSNQSPVGLWDNMVTVLANKSDVVRFVNTSSSSSFEATLSKSFDSKLLKPLKKVLQDPSKHKFIVLHLMGSHMDYSKRYPSSFSVFQGSNDKLKRIAEYDNSILFTDSIVDGIINLVERNGGPNSTVIYLSDHGENVYDEDDGLGHDWTDEVPKCNVEIPFLVWMAPRNVGDSSFVFEPSRPFVSDDLFHSIIDLNHISFSGFDTSRSLFSHSFNATRKRVLEDGKDYDLK